MTEGKLPAIGFELSLNPIATLIISVIPAFGNPQINPTIPGSSIEMSNLFPALIRWVLVADFTDTRSAAGEGRGTIPTKQSFAIHDTTAPANKQPDNSIE